MIKIDNGYDPITFVKLVQNF